MPLTCLWRATLDLSFLSQDYCSEAHLTRRLNDLGCKNIINVSRIRLGRCGVISDRIVWKVVEWAYIEEKFWRNEMGKISKSEPRHRICYEYADYGDFWDLISWYHMQRYRSHPKSLYIVVIV